MPMNKQTKQLIALGGLVVVAGVVAYVFVFKGEDLPEKVPANNAAKLAEPAATPTPNSGTVKPGTTPTTPGAATPVVQDQDLEIPEPHKFTHTPYTWPFDNGGANFVARPEKNIFAAFDPFLVQNIDVVDPQRREYIESLKQEWILDGLIETRQQLSIFDGAGKALLGNSITAPRPQTRPVVKMDPKTKKPMRDKDDKVIVEDLPVFDDAGQPVFERKLDTEGKPVSDKNGNPVYVQDILYIRVNPDGKPLLDKDGKSVLDEAGRPLPDKDGKPRADKDGKPIVIRNPGPTDRVKRLVVQVDEMEKVLVTDAEGVPILDEKGKLMWTVKPVIEKDKNGKEIPGGKILKVDDNTLQSEIKLVLEATFKDKRRPYKEKDRLTGTRFTILKIFQKRRYWNDTLTDFRVRAGIDLISDTGAPLTIFVTDDDRYTVEEATEKK